jgi:hypothetical protein
VLQRVVTLSLFYFLPPRVSSSWDNLAVCDIGAACLWWIS